MDSKTVVPWPQTVVAVPAAARLAVLHVLAPS